MTLGPAKGTVLRSLPGVVAWLAVCGACSSSPVAADSATAPDTISGDIADISGDIADISDIAPDGSVVQDSSMDASMASDVSMDAADNGMRSDTATFDGVGADAGLDVGSEVGMDSGADVGADASVDAASVDAPIVAFLPRLLAPLSGGRVSNRRPHLRWVPPRQRHPVPR